MTSNIDENNNIGDVKAEIVGKVEEVGAKLKQQIRNLNLLPDVKDHFINKISDIVTSISKEINNIQVTILLAQGHYHNDYLDLYAERDNQFGSTWMYSAVVSLDKLFEEIVTRMKQG